MKLIHLGSLVLLCSLWGIPVHCASQTKVPKSFVIIETLTSDQNGELYSTFCPGFMLTERNLITARGCASAAPENLRVYRNTDDCSARNNSIPVERSAERDSINEPTVVTLQHPVSSNMVAMTQFPYLDLEESLSCFFLTETDNRLTFNMRRAFYYDAVKNGIFKITTIRSPGFAGKPIPGAILMNSIGWITGVNFENNQLYAPVGSIIPFFPVAVDNRKEQYF